MTDEDDDQAQPSPRQRKIIHVDMDAFYASVEQRDNLVLHGKPVAVGGSKERVVVAAASYEASQVRRQVSHAIGTVKRQCPDLTFVKPRFDGQLCRRSRSDSETAALAENSARP